MAHKKLSGMDGAKAKKGRYAGKKMVSKKACLRSNGRLKKGCMWGRGKYKGKVFKSVR